MSTSYQDELSLSIQSALAWSPTAWSPTVWSPTVWSSTVWSPTVWSSTSFLQEDFSDNNIPTKDIIRPMQKIKDVKRFFDSVSNIDWNIAKKDHSIEQQAVTELKRKHTPETQKLITTILTQTIHYTWDQFTAELDKCVDILLSKYSKFNVYCNTLHKIGSEHWILALVWNKIKDKVVEIVSGLGDATNEYPIVILDGCMYSGTSIAGLVDQFTYDNGHSYNHNPYIILMPFSSKNARKLVSDILQLLKHEHIYSVTIPQYTLDKYNSDLGTSIYAPVYFDHKIAGTSSSVPGVYNHVVKNGYDRSKVIEISEMIQKWIDAEMM